MKLLMAMTHHCRTDANIFQLHSEQLQPVNNKQRLGAVQTKALLQMAKIFPFIYLQISPTMGCSEPCKAAASMG
jgi:hypothetical protein